MIKKFPVRHIKRLSSFTNKPFQTFVSIFLIGTAAGIAFEEFIGIGTWHSYYAATDKINICFTPPSNCGSLIAQQISLAQESVFVQAYGLTNASIVDQLIKAKMRGVKVEVLVDRSNLVDKYSKISTLKKAGITIGIDKVPGIAHNKVMIIDQARVITGSFNFTDNANKNNSENVVLIEDSVIAKRYLENWFSRRSTQIY